MIEYIGIVLGIVMTIFIISRILRCDTFYNSQHMDYLTQWRPDDNNDELEG